nr:hypothetical protein CFP56_63628 [Quercus suber]
MHKPKSTNQSAWSKRTYTMVQIYRICIFSLKVDLYTIIIIGLCCLRGFFISLCLSLYQLELVFEGQSLWWIIRDRLALARSTAGHLAGRISHSAVGLASPRPKLERVINP